MLASEHVRFGVNVYASWDIDCQLELRSWGTYDASRYLAECRAKRSLAEWATAVSNQFVLAQIAMPYDLHPDYRRDWQTTSKS